MNAVPDVSMNEIAAAPTTTEPLLRTLAPALRQLEVHLRAWLDSPQHYPQGPITRATLEGLATDLHRKAEALDVDRPLLVIMLMGGTGVGKSTLLNALAGGPIAEASFARPTTRDPVVYFHQSIKPDRLDPALQHCRLAPHDRPELEQKIIVDTPDLDSNDLANREKLQQLLPVADVVLYVGSQEKYHDRLGWDLFLNQRHRRAFAFVLNKWDRCLGDGAAGARPDHDLLRDLEAEGFREPLLFRTCAQLWAESGRANGPVQPPEGEQFQDLVRWLNAGLSRLEIEAIKARGISQLLAQLDRTLGQAVPPELTAQAEKTRTAWQRILEEEAAAIADVLLNTLEPYQREIEHHFAVESQRRFRGLMAGYLRLVTSVRYAGSTLRDRIPFLPRPAQSVQTPTTWDLAAFTRACTSAAGERQLDARGRALANRLQVEAGRQGFPLELLAEPVECAAHLDWHARYASSLIAVLQEVEGQFARPTGTRRWLQSGIVLLADWAPLVALLVVCVLKLWHYAMKDVHPQLGDVLLPVFVVLAVLVILHIVIALVLPLRWPAIRGEFRRQLERRLIGELTAVYGPIPDDVAARLLAERRQVNRLSDETREVAVWLAQREHATSIAGLYGAGPPQS